MFNLRYYYKKKFSYMTQEEFAAFLGLSQSFLSQMLNGSRLPSMKTAQSISEKTGIPLERFFKQQSA